MSKVMRGVVIAAVALVVVVGGALAWVWVSGGSGEPSTSLVAPEITTTTEAPDTTVAPDTTAPATTAPATTAPATTAPATTAPATTVPDTTEGGSTGTAATLYVIDPAQSEVRFILDEVLRGSDTTVVGATDQVTAQILVDPADPAASQLGTVVVNARTLATDSSLRDRAIRGRILQSAEDEFEFIEFAPTEVTGLPATLDGGPVELTVTGDLTIRAITQPVTFEVVIVSITPELLEGTASAEVLRSDFELAIPSVPSVADVSDEVELEIDFVAVAE